MKKIFLVLWAILIAASVIGFFAFGKKTGPETKSQEAISEEKGTYSSPKMDAKYIEYSQSLLENTKENRRVLFFYANWCPTCRPADSNFKQNESKIPHDVKLIRVNYNDTETDDEEKELAKKYGVTYQHTFVQIESSGKEITKWNGGQIDELVKNLK